MATHNPAVMVAGRLKDLPAGDTLTTASIPNLPESQITNLTTDLAAKEAVAV